jgi:hypothetical protein
MLTQLLKNKTNFVITLKDHPNGLTLCEHKFRDATSMLVLLSKIDVRYTDIETLIKTGYVYTMTDFGKAHLFFQ